jgi:hypothetical protein
MDINTFHQQRELIGIDRNTERGECVRCPA